MLLQLSTKEAPTQKTTSKKLCTKRKIINLKIKKRSVFLAANCSRKASQSQQIKKMYVIAGFRGEPRLRSSPAPLGP